MWASALHLLRVIATHPLTHKIAGYAVRAATAALVRHVRGITRNYKTSATYRT